MRYTLYMRLLSILIFIVSSAFGQKARPDTVFSDCVNARVITIKGNGKIGKTIAPNGAGEKNEIGENKQKTKYVFEQEHNTAWYKLLINTTGHLCFEIIPNTKEDDYDFMLFKGGFGDFCDSLHKFRIKPIRACISRNNEEIDGKTGMSYKGKKELVKLGVGDAFVSTLYVTKGETYYLVLDNVYDNGDGHTIKYYFEESVQIKGMIFSEDNHPIVADISLTNALGDTIFLTKSNASGTYDFSTPLRRNYSYSLNFYNDSNFVFSKNIGLKDSIKLSDIRTILPKLKKGSKYSVGSINFKPGLTEYLPQALPSINNLFMLMKRNKNLKILIIGHSNGRAFETEKGIIKFTTARAEKIRNYLVFKGIDPARIETIGKGDNEMLFQLPGASLEEQEQNRRVEIMVLEY